MIRGCPVVSSYQLYQSVSTGMNKLLPGRSSDFRFILLAAPSRSYGTALISGILQRSSPVTAAGPSPIHTGFPLQLVAKHLEE